MFPLRDENPTERFAFTTIAIIGLNVAMWLVVQGAGADPWFRRSICELGLIPVEFLHRARPGTMVPLGPGEVCVLGSGPAWFTPFTSMFLHGSWFHVIGNLWFLWVFGNNVEDQTGHLRFLVFYLICGLAAAAAQVIISPSSRVPMVGASGAIGGVMGAYAVLFPHARIRTLLVLGFLVRVVDVPAIFMLGYWFLLQLLGVFPSIGGIDRGGVAFAAHVGGFAAGLTLVNSFRRRVRRRVQLWT